MATHSDVIAACIEALQEPMLPPGITPSRLNQDQLQRVHAMCVAEKALHESMSKLGPGSPQQEAKRAKLLAERQIFYAEVDKARKAFQS